MARERGLIVVDVAGFDAAMDAAAREPRARPASSAAAAACRRTWSRSCSIRPKFLGYEHVAERAAWRVLALREGRASRSSDRAGDEAIVILDARPFYAESGGQVGDTGELDEQGVRFDRERHAEARRPVPRPCRHAERSRQPEARRPPVSASVDAARRGAIVLNHSATHLLHAALREVLGTHVQQKGSLVAPDRLRFDFSHFQPMTRRRAGRDRAPGQRRDPRATSRGDEVHHMGMQEALDFGAMALFGEKYGEHVRVLKMGDFSTELCGGTHVGRTGDIGLFKIVSEGGVSAGVRRIEAVTGQGALDHVAAEERRLDEAAACWAAPAGDVGRQAARIARPPEEAGARTGGDQGQGGLAARRPIWRPGDRRRTGSRCWRRAWKAWMPRRCAMRWTLKQQLGDAVDRAGRAPTARRRWWRA
jgi:alanyl-tRNA synthetase